MTFAHLQESTTSKWFRNPFSRGHWTKKSDRCGQFHSFTEERILPNAVNPISNAFVERVSIQILYQESSFYKGRHISFIGLVLHTSLEYKYTYASANFKIELIFRPVMLLRHYTYDHQWY